MRPIKFRAWYQENKQMICPVTPLHTGGIIWGDQGYDSSQAGFIIEQFTGLHDKNGWEVFEGDILRWNGKSFPITVETIHGMRFMWGEDQLVYAYAATGEVIGNMHEDPEMLK